MYDISEYQSTYNKPIDECLNIIAAARSHNQAIKSICLSPMYYEWFKSGAQTLINRPLVEDELMQLDGVNIERGTIYQTKNIVLEYYTGLN